jgi:hypothetical protein
LIIMSLLVSLLSGCEGMKYHEICMSAAGGALLGWIVGHQYDEDGAGAAIGAGIFASGDFLKQLDELPKHRLEEAADDVRNGDALLSRRSEPRSILTEAGR